MPDFFTRDLGGLLNEQPFQKEKAKEFFYFFEESEDWILSMMKENSSTLIWETKRRLQSVFPYFKQGPDVEFDFSEGKNIFIFHHFQNETLKNDGALFLNMMPKSLHARWVFILQE